jgi:hypothetical protein
METKQIDMLFLELSQFTQAKTEKELKLERILLQVLTAWETEAKWGDGIHEKHKCFFNQAMKAINKNYEPSI